MCRISVRGLGDGEQVNGDKTLVNKRRGATGDNIWWSNQGYPLPTTNALCHAMSLADCLTLNSS